MIMGFGFGDALELLRQGAAVRRTSWNWETFSGRDSLILVPGTPTLTVDADRPLGKALPSLVGEELSYGTHIDLVHAGGSGVFVAPWEPSQADLLAGDWEVIR